MPTELAAGATRGDATRPARPAREDDTPAGAALALADAHAFTVEASGRLTFDQPERLARMLGLGTDALDTARPAWEARLDGGAVRDRRAALATLDWPGARIALDYAVRDERGGHRHVREVVEAQDRRGQLARVGVLVDRTADVRSTARAVWLARHDETTDLPNRDSFIEAATQSAALSARAGLDAGLIRVRLDKMHALSSQYGPDAEARLLRAIAERLSEVVRAPDLTARLGGADFAVAVIAEKAEARRTQRRIEEALGETPVQTPHGPLSIDVRLAFATLRARPGAVEEALQDTAAELDGAMPAPAVRQALDPSTDVLAALEQDRIGLAFQPIVHAATGAVHHHECLLRVRNDAGRMVSAGPIVQHAERLGLVRHLDERALLLAAPHLLGSPDLRLALNVSAGTLGDDASAARYLDGLEALGDAARRVTVEMTETLAVDDPDAAARFSAAVRRLGCRFAVDDFGSGYTTFRNLMAVEADSVKLDGTLVRGIATDTAKQTVMRMMVDLAGTFGLHTVAEMVETEADAARLRRLGVDYLQGYLFGRPAPTPVRGPVQRHRMAG